MKRLYVIGYAVLGMLGSAAHGEPSGPSDLEAHVGLGIGPATLKVDESDETDKKGRATVLDLAVLKHQGAFALSGGLGYLLTSLEGDSDLYEGQKYSLKSPYLKGTGWWLIDPHVYAGFSLNLIAGIEADFGPKERAKKIVGLAQLDLMYRFRREGHSWTLGAHYGHDLTVRNREYSVAMVSLGYFFPVRRVEARAAEPKAEVVPATKSGSLLLEVATADGVPLKDVRYEVKRDGKIERSGVLVDGGSKRLDSVAKGVYEIGVDAEGYRSEQRRIIVGENQTSIVKILLVTLDRFELRHSFDLGVINFEFAKATLTKESLSNLDKIVRVLEENPGLKRLDIEGHTDNIGGRDFNMKLSHERAKAVADYLISKGVESERLSYRGFGTDVPVASNDTEEGRAKNRRVEFVVKELAGN